MRTKMNIQRVISRRLKRHYCDARECDDVILPCRGQKVMQLIYATRLPRLREDILAAYTEVYRGPVRRVHYNATTGQQRLYGAFYAWTASHRSVRLVDIFSRTQQASAVENCDFSCRLTSDLRHSISSYVWKCREDRGKQRACVWRASNDGGPGRTCTPSVLSIYIYICATLITNYFLAMTR